MSNSSKLKEEEAILLQEIRTKRAELYEIMNNVDLNSMNAASAHLGLEDRQLVMYASLNEACEEGYNMNHMPPTSLLQSLKEEVENLKRDYDTVLQQRERFLDEVERLEESIKEMNEAMSDTNSQTKGPSKVKPCNLRVNLVRRFKKEKERLREVLTGIFPDDSDAIDLLSKLVQHYTKEDPGKYLKLEPDDEQRMALLLKSHLFEAHPDDHLQVRMKDLS